MDVRGVSEGGASIPVPPRRGAPFPPGPQEVPLRVAARAPRDFASETFRGFCGRARGTGGGERGMRGGCEGRGEGKGERGEGGVGRQQYSR